MKVDRCLRAGAMAMGAVVEINTIPGYLPQRNNRAMAQVFGGNVEVLFGPGSFDIGGHRTGSIDMGDIAHVKPVIHWYLASAVGKTHGADFRISEPEHAYLTPVKLLAMIAIDMLYGDAAPAKKILAEFEPAMTKTPTLLSNAACSAPSITSPRCPPNLLAGIAQGSQNRRIAPRNGYCALTKPLIADVCNQSLRTEAS